MSQKASISLTVPAKELFELPLFIRIRDDESFKKYVGVFKTKNNCFRFIHIDYYQRKQEQVTATIKIEESLYEEVIDTFLNRWDIQTGSIINKTTEFTTKECFENALSLVKESLKSL